ncbi:glycosyltransferase family 2 protein [Planctomonas sp. JC2975]|uniref:glycosyltransferase family 2 protein n=1 Tax=Planctomonas sp. JC2975 TaxID=2729626 RepID=UPI00147678A4|nr:glycosyltransferase family A protein [Planctomonas sp. JC2975]NNC11879.1 glycosyltransferase family 2 protein [Planctomonas sp. JC2975]
MAAKPQGTKPKVSVVLATSRADSSPFLEAAVESVLHQDYSLFELLIVDDGSPSSHAISRLVQTDPRINSIRVSGIGVARARNIGANHTEGSLIAFLDDDDLWESDRLTRHLAVMDSNPNAVISYCRMKTIDETGREIAPGDQTPVRDIHDVYRRTTGILMPNMVIRRSAFIQVGGFDPAFEIAEDLDLLLRLAKVGNVAFVDGRPLVSYRSHADNTTLRHRDVAVSVKAVLQLHKWAALQRNDRVLAADLASSIRANGRYAAWGTSRAVRGLVRNGHIGSAISEIAWAARFAPGAPVSWLARRIGPGRRAKTQ